MAKSEINYLGFEINNNNTIIPEKIKTETIQQISQPKTKKALQSFIGSVNFYRNHIKDFHITINPLFDMLHQSSKTLQWNATSLSAFEKIKNMVANSLVPLNLFDPKLPISIETDASLTGMACALFQKVNNEKLLIYYASKKFNKSQSNYSAIVREILALKWAITRKFYNILKDVTFEICVDNKPITDSLQNISTSNNNLLNRWLEELKNFNFTVKHISTEENCLCDLLSRNPNEPPNETDTPILCTINVDIFDVCH